MEAEKKQEDKVLTSSKI